MAEKKTQLKELLQPALGIVALALILVLIFNQYGALKQAREKVAEEQLALARVQAQLSDLEQAKAQAAELEQQFARYELMMPANPGEGVLISTLRSYAEDTGANFVSISFGERVNKSGYNEMPVELVFEGSYHQLLRLLNRLQAGQRIIRIDELKVTRGGQGLTVIKADIVASAFYAPR